MQCIVMGRPLRALTKGFRGTTASQTPDPGPHGVVDCAAHSDICVQTRGIDALTPVESLYSERLPMHTFCDRVRPASETHRNRTASEPPQNRTTSELLRNSFRAASELPRNRLGTAFGTAPPRGHFRTASERLRNRLRGLCLSFRSASAAVCVSSCLCPCLRLPLISAGLCLRLSVSPPECALVGATRPNDAAGGSDIPPQRVQTAETCSARAAGHAGAAGDIRVSCVAVGGQGCECSARGVGGLSCREHWW